MCVCVRGLCVYVRERVCVILNLIENNTSIQCMTETGFDEGVLLFYNTVERHDKPGDSDVILSYFIGGI